VHRSLHITTHGWKVWDCFKPLEQFFWNRWLDGRKSLEIRIFELKFQFEIHGSLVFSITSYNFLKIFRSCISQAFAKRTFSSKCRDCNVLAKINFFYKSITGVKYCKLIKRYCPIFANNFIWTLLQKQIYKKQYDILFDISDHFNVTCIWGIMRFPLSATVTWKLCENNFVIIIYEL